MSNTEWREGIVPGYRTKTIKRGDVTIVIHRPELPDKERRKRENQVETSLTGFAKSLAQREAIHT